MKKQTPLPTKQFLPKKRHVLIGLSASLLASILTISGVVSYNFFNPSLLKPVQTQANVVQASVLPITTEASPTATEKIEERNYSPQIFGTQLNVPILMYHYIGNNPNPTDYQRDSLSVTPDKFEEQMKYIASNGYSTSNLDTLYAALHKVTTLPNKTIILTFDDGYIDFYYNAYPILKLYNLHATVFIPTGLMNQGPYLTWDQIKEMSSSGLISFQAHTVHHSHLPSLSNESVSFEITESRRVLESQLGTKVNFMAFPFGSTDSRIISLTKGAGYMGAIGTWTSRIQSEGTIYNMPRLRIGGGTTFEAFKSFL